MAKPLIYEAAGAVCHVMARGVSVTRAVRLHREDKNSADRLAALQARLGI